MIGVSGSSEEVATVQAFLAHLGHTVSVNGTWDTDTTKALSALRSDADLWPGPLDTELWLHLLATDPSNDLGEAASPVEGVLVPAGAILVGEAPFDHMTTASARYVLPYHISNPQKIVLWYTQRGASSRGGPVVEGWNWCRRTNEGTDLARFYWWNAPDHMLVVVVRDMGKGRVDILVAVAEGASPQNCWGHFTSTTTTTTTTTAAPRKTTSGTSTSPSCWVGQNLEDCHDSMGIFGIGPYYDCKGSRSVWWSSNWWILYFIGDTPVVSKNRYGCS